MGKLVAFLCLLGVLCTLHCFAWADQNLQRLNRFQQHYNNSRSDIIFLMDLSGSVGTDGFKAEKKFVSSLLSEISVQPEASRVAVILFGSNVERKIDYIGIGTTDKNKCTFMKEMDTISYGYGMGLTNTNGAFIDGKQLLEAAKRKGYLRDNVNRAFVLLTDGYWNTGGNPATTARELRDRSKWDAEIYSIGVAWASATQLKEISADDSKVIMAATFKDFVTLAARIRGDQIEKLYQHVDNSICGFKCDPRAFCSCGTISGVYQCACGPGYDGSGKPGHCQVCPVGTYKTYTSPDPCKKCPDFSSTKKEGSMSKADCTCFTGYDGNPGKNEPCVVVKCPLISQSLTNGKVKDCGNEYKQTCTFTCNQNHHIAGEENTERKISCQSNGQWSAGPPTCVAVVCQLPSKPLNMIVSCPSSATVGTKCTYKCETGYIRNGPAERECQPEAQWSGVLPSCQIVTCPALRQILNVEIQPPSCLTKETNYNDGCSQSCKLGFTAQNAVIKRLCGADGTWSGTELTCKDTTPPSITCPDDITASTDIGKPNKELSFPPPIAKDNTMVQAGSVTVTHAPSNIESPYKFPIGITQIDYTATDSAGNTAECSFRVLIKDDENPKFTYCPQNIEVTIDKPGETSALVDWKAPTYTDNSGKATLTYQSHTPPHSFSYGTVFAVSYIVKDGSGNKATCEFFIKVDKKKCPARDPPINGALACKTVGQSGDFCFPSCQNPYDFNGPHAYYYICTPAQTWQPVPPNPIFMARWPDCTSIAPASGTEQSMKFYYFSGSCHDSKSARDEIKNNFLSLLGLYLKSIGQGGCENPANARTCSTDSVVLTCGKLEAVAGLRFRRATQNNFEINVQIQVKSSEDMTTQTQALNTVTSKLEQLPSSGKEGDNLRNLRVQGDVLSLQKVQRVGNPTAFCSGGSIFDTGSQAQTGGKCVSCLGGKYYNKDTKACTSCPKGSYTEHPGRIGCSNCPKGTTTATEGTHNRTECKAPCDPGSYSSTGLQGCQACPKGEFQTGYFGIKCSQCPGTTSTLTVGSTTMWECGMPCTRGTYSNTGVEPCLPCPTGYYSSQSNSVRCTPCPGELSTHGEGAADSSMCVKIDYCASNPCINGGSCKSERDNFKCTCAPGYYGNRCELEINECSKTPCSKDATCVNLVDNFECMCSPFYSGRYCAERKKACHPTLCQNNGVCTDMPDGFHCGCPAGFTGVYCERTTYECASSPCKNGGLCISNQGGFKCQCAPGWTGETCQTNIDNCAKNGLCLNGGECVDGINAFTCKCVPGYVGDRCQFNKDNCASNPCRNGGFCIDEVNDYECICRPTFHGKSCEKRVTLSNFDLEFSKDATTFANKTLYHPIRQFTVAFWMRAAATETESGTPVSYAVPIGDKFQDNALVVRDFNSFILVIMNKESELKMSANDDLWHHIAVSWSSTTGLVSAYRDGLKISSIKDFQKDVVIPGGGHLLVGQEQDEVGRNFSAGEAFDGSLSQLNMWNRVLSDAEISEMSRYRCDNYRGDLVAWADFSLGMRDISKSIHFCTGAKVRYSDWNKAPPKTSGVVQEGSSCGAQSSYGQCVSLDNQTPKDLNLFSTKCTKDGFYCSDAAQNTNDVKNPPCPDFKARFECPYTPPNRCSTNPCRNGGTCENGLGGYQCICRDGYVGSNCEKMVGCTHNSVFAYGTVTSDSSRASFSCSSGYVLQGASTLTCVAGRWNAPLPECVDADECKTNNGGCKQVCINTFGSFTCACNKGYKLNGKTDCQDLDECAINNGNCQDKCHNFVGGYKCSCRAGYKVSEDLHSCEDIDNCKTGENDCKQLCINTRGSFDCACSPGFNLAADKKSCDRISCSNLGAPNNGKVDAGDKLFETIASYTCNAGYKLNGPSSRTCLANGKWSGADPGCEPIQCILLGSIYNGKVIGSGTGYGKKYTFDCVQGFRLVGKSELICQQDSTWSGSTPMCLPAGCQPLSPPAHGAVIGNALYTGASVLIRCDKGYQLTDPNANFRTCQASGSWAGKTAVCEVVDCGAPPPLGNGTITGGNYKYGQKVLYQCKTGFGLSGPAERTCQADGKWSGVDPTCLYRSCGFPGSPENGQFNGSDYHFDQVVTYECNLGYNLKGVKERLCLHSGKWSDSVPTCEIVNCGDPGTPANGERLGNDFTWGSRLIFDCNPGFSLKGTRIRQCKETGQWTGTQTTCISGVCGAANLIGPTGSFNTPGYPNSYSTNLYCRWDVTVSSVKKAAIRIDRLETETDDTVEIRDAGSNQLITILSGLLQAPVIFTSASNKIDVRFLSSAHKYADLDGLKATYLATTCGGNILSLSAQIESPNYPSNYPNNIECTWQIFLNKPFILRFKYFKTYDSRDTLEIYNKLSDISPKTLTDTFYGSRGFLTATSTTGQMFVRFKTDNVYNAPGFQAVVEAP